MACRYSTLSYAAYKKSASGFSDGRAYLTNMFKQAQQHGFNTYRFFIQGDYSYLTTAPGALWGHCVIPARGHVGLLGCVGVGAGSPHTPWGGAPRHVQMEAPPRGRTHGGVMHGDQCPLSVLALECCDQATGVCYCARGVAQQPPPFSAPPTAAGVYDEQIFQGLDFVLDEASKYGVKVTPIFLNLWNDDGVPLVRGFGQGRSRLAMDMGHRFCA